VETVNTLVLITDGADSAQGARAMWPHDPGRREPRFAADWRILPPPGGEATLFKIAAHCDDRG
jgi:hypothetical protein